MSPDAAHSHKVTPLHVGRCLIGEHHALGDPHSDDDRMEFVMYSFLVECGGGEYVLVDLGPKTTGFLNGMFRQFKFFRPTGEDDTVQPHGNVFDHLRRRGIRPEDVKHIVITHMHADHHGMDTQATPGACLDFPDAIFHVSRKGIVYNISERVNGKWHSYLDWAFGDFLMEGERIGRTCFADDAEVRPGINTIYLGGHSPCSQAVRIETNHGPVIITSDEAYLWSLMERGVLPRLFTTPEAIIAANDRLITLAEEEDAILLPTHEPLMWQMAQELGDNWLEAAREKTRQAVKGYRAAGAHVVR